MNCLSFFLKIGVTLASFHISGYVEVFKVFSKIILSGRTTELSHKSNTCPDISSVPVALFGFRFRISESISSFCMAI